MSAMRHPTPVDQLPSYLSKTQNGNNGKSRSLAPIVVAGGILCLALYVGYRHLKSINEGKYKLKKDDGKEPKEQDNSD
jgi:hypothetical protein